MSSVSSAASTSSNFSSSLASAANSTSSSASGSTISFSGLASGVDTASIISAMESYNNQQITALQTQGQGYANLQTAFSNIQSGLTSLQTAANQLSLSTTSTIAGLSATVSNTNVLTATTGSAAVAGNYSLTVNSLAQVEQVASQGYADPNTTLQQGTMTIQVGSNSPINVTLTSQNDTLQGLANAINAAGGDVQASIINDGSSTPYRLLLTSTEPGAVNAIAVTNNLTTGSGASINPTQVTIQSAADAQISLGSGPGALSVTSPSNTVTGLIPGVQLNLLSATPGQPVNVAVATNTSGAVSAVQSFVTAYNAVVDYISQNSTFNASTNQGGILLGNATTSNLSSALAAAMTANTSGSTDTLGSIGLSFNQSGDLELNQTTFTQAMSTAAGATAVQNLFAMSGTASNTGITFISGTSKTQPSGPTPYEVQITSPATQASATASNALASSITIDNTNNTFSVSVNGVTSAPIAITAGTYTPDQLAAQIQQQINSSSSMAGNLVSVTVNGSGELQITSQAYGSAASVAIGSGSAVGATGPLGFNGNETGNGTDVAGDFVVNGQTEAATGTGQYLTGKSGNANTAGLEVQSTLTAPGTSSLTVSQGLASQLNQVLNEYLSPISGQLTTVNSQYQTDINNINAQITKDNTNLQTQTSSLQQQFAAMEVSVNNLKSVQSELAGLVPTSSSSTGG